MEKREFKFAPTGDVYSYERRGGSILITHPRWKGTDCEELEYSFEEFEDYVRSGSYILLPEPKVEAVTLTFYFIGRPDKHVKAEKLESGWKVDWGTIECYYTNEQVQDFLKAGHWVVVGVN
jgi:hypothetical protein